MDDEQFGPGKRFWVRDEMDGFWGDADTREGAEALLAQINEHENKHGYVLRVDDMED